MADEQIIIQYIVQVDQAIKDIERTRQVIDETKLSIQTLASQSGASLNQAANQIINSLKSIDIGGIENLGKFLKLDPDVIANIETTESNLSKMRQEAISRVRDAVRELNKETVAQANQEKKDTQDKIRLAQQYNQIIRQQTVAKFEPQFNTAELKAYADSISKIVNEAMVQASRGGTSFATALQQQTTDVQQLNSAYVLYGKTVDTVSQTIINKSKETGLSYQQVAEQLKQVSPEGMSVAIDAAMQKLTNSGKMVTQQIAQEKQAQREYEQATAKGYQNMSVAAQQFGQQVQAVKQQLVAQSQATGQPFNVVAQQMQQAGTSAAVLNTAMKQLNQTGQQTTGVFNTLGSTISQALAVGLGINLYNFIQQLLTFFKEAAVAGKELAQAFFQLDVGIRAVRRSGVDITSAEMLQNLDRLSEKFGVFSKKSLVEGSAALINLVRDMGFTKEQIFELQDAIATLAIVNGRSMDEVQKTVALALSSGYTEGLQRLGVSINRVNIAARAYAMGFSKGYMNLTEHERALATLSLVMEKTAKYADDLTNYLNTEAGQIDATKAAIEDQTAALGGRLVPVTKVWNEQLLILITWLNRLLTIINPVVDAIAMLSDVFYRGSQALEKFIKEGKGFSPQTIFEAWKTALSGFDRDVARFFYKNPWLYDLLHGTDIKKTIDLKYKFSLESTDVPIGTPEMSGEAMKEAGKTLEEYVSGLHDDIEKENRNFQNRMESLERDFIRDMAKIDRELTRDLEEIDRENQRKRADIILNGQRKEADAIKDYNQKLIDLERDYQNKVREENIKYAEDQASAGRKYRDDEIQAELDYQEKLRQMREEFLLDLQGALQERDAKQVLNLVRRYNLDKDQAARDFKNNQDERRRQFEQENEERARQHQLRLEEMAREKEDRLRALAEEQAQKIAQIREDTQLQLAEQQIRYEQEKEDRNRKAEEDREERRIQREQQIDELKIDSANRLKEIVAALANEKDMTAAMLQEIGAEYRRMYGPNGIIEAQIRYYIKMLQVAALARAQWGGKVSVSANENVAGVYTSGGGSSGSGGSKPYSGFAEGGIMYANKPTTVMFGEGGLEKAEFTPLNHVGKDTGRVVGTNLESAPSMNGTIALRVLLSPELIAEIQENTMNQTANILFEVQRRS